MNEWNFLIISWSWKILLVISIFFLFNKKTKLYLLMVLFLLTFFLYFTDMYLIDSRKVYVVKKICGLYVISYPRPSQKGAGNSLDVILNVNNIGEITFIVGKDEFAKKLDNISVNKEVCINAKVGGGGIDYTDLVSVEII